MAVYGVAEAKNKFTHLLDRVEKGENITITRHGKPVAELRGTPRAAPVRTPEERRAAYAKFVKRRNAQPPLETSVVELLRSAWDEPVE
jgi:prevent-host-death family protein